MRAIYKTKKKHRREHFTVNPVRTGVICGRFGWNNIFKAKILFREYSPKVIITVDARTIAGVAGPGKVGLQYGTFNDFFREWNLVDRRILIEKKNNII